MPTHKPPAANALDGALDAVTAYAAERRIPVVTGQADIRDRSCPVVRFRPVLPLEKPDPATAGRLFLQSLAELDVAMLVVSRDRLTEPQWSGVSDFMEESEEVMEPADADVVELNRVIKAGVRESRRHIGQTGKTIVTAITRNPTTIVQWVEMAEWFTFVAAAEEAMIAAAAGGVEEDDDDGWFDALDESPEGPPRAR